MEYFELTDTLTKFGFLSSFLFNLFFIYLTVIYIKNVSGTYKKLVIFFSIVGILFSGLEVYARPFAHNFNNSLFYFSLNNSGPESLVIFAIMLGAGFYVVIVSSIAVQFIYRYLCLLESEKVRKMKFRQKTQTEMAFSQKIGFKNGRSQTQFGLAKCGAPFRILSAHFYHAPPTLACPVKTGQKPVENRKKNRRERGKKRKKKCVEMSEDEWLVMPKKEKKDENITKN